MRKKKGFTLIELLVVIAIIAMLLAILMPALGKVKKLAMRLVCGTNVKGLGTAMNVYAFDYDDEFPKQGKTGDVTWSDTTPGYRIPNKPWDAATEVTIGASLYMLVREADVSPKSFVCPASGDQEYKISEDDLMTPADKNDLELTDIWDFGSYPAGGWTNGGDGGICHYSYSYQQVYSKLPSGTQRAYPPTASGNAARVVLADKSPWCDINLQYRVLTAIPDDWTEVIAKIYLASGVLIGEISSSDSGVQVANSALHDREGQNVLYNDGHNEFAKRPDVSVNNDNIYTLMGTAGTEDARRIGRFATTGGSDTSNFYSYNSKDTMLVHDSICSN